MIKNKSIKIGIKIKPKPLNSQAQIIVSSSRKDQSPQKIPTIHLSLPNNVDKKFHVDAIHDANSSLSTTFKDLHIDRFVQKFIQGFNVTIIAYGQTGAGKTYAMEGNDKQLGIVNEAIRMIYNILQPKNQERVNQDGLKQLDLSLSKNVKISCAYIQLYNEKLQDLLGQQKVYQQGLKLRWQPDRDFIVEDISYNHAKTAKQMESIWRKGTKRRIISANRVHDMSSRSHTLFSLLVTDIDSQGNFRSRQMTFVDLAGSERLFDSIGKLNKESIQINKSLFVLRKIIKILQQSSVQNKQLYIPYRQSKLTSLLKKSLGGNCLTMMVACIDPTLQQRQETLLTLSYAISTGRIHNTARVNIDQQALENRQLKGENQKLKKQLEIVWSQLDLAQKERNIHADKKYIGQYSHKIIQCISTIRQLIKSNKQIRQQLDQEKKINKKQQLEIEMLLEEKSMAKRSQSIKKSPQKQQRLSPIKNKGENNHGYSSPIKLNEANQVMMRMSNSIKTPLKFAIKHRRRSTSRKLNDQSSVLKRKKYTVYKTQPNEVLTNPQQYQKY